MKRSQSKAFTLVELIVVITILAILGTIAFISLQGYSKSARDTRRISDVSNIKTSLELFILNTGKYPLPDDGSEVSFSGGLLRTQGIVGDTVTTNLSKNLPKKPIDPLLETEYVFSVSNAQKEFELLSYFEGDLAYNSILNTANAANNYTARIIGTYNGIYLKTTKYIVPTPSIINSEVDSGDLILNDTNIKSQVINGGKNFPKMGLHKKLTSTGGLTGFNFYTFTGTILKEKNINKNDSAKILENDEMKKDLANKIISAYSGSTLAQKGIYKKIVETNPEDLITLINEIVVKSNVKKVIPPIPEEPPFPIVQDPNCISDFELKEELLDGVQDYYVQSCTGLKWETDDSGTTMAWNTNISYAEPTWNGTEYEYPAGRISTNYPAFKYCTDKGPGWRLPTKKEMFSITTTLIKNSSGRFTKLESITTYDAYWTSTDRLSTSYAWVLNDGAGYTYYIYSANTSWVKVVCVHD